MAELSDAELRRKLIENGVDAGPITDTTRQLYIRKLEKVATEAKKNRRRSSIGRSVKSNSLIGFSSEDSESDSAAADKKRKILRRRTTGVSPLVAVPSTSDLNGGGGSRTNGSPLTPSTDDVKYSSGPLTRAKLSSLSTIESDFSDIELTTPKSITGSSGFFNGLRSLPQKTVGRFSRDSTANHSYIQNGHRSGSSSNLETEFRTEEDPISTTNYSQYVSWLLLGIVLIFFVIVGVLYLGVTQNTQIQMPVNSYAKHICKGFTHVNCIESQDDLKTTLNAVYYLHNYLSEVAGKFDCSEGKIGDRFVSAENIKLALASKYNRVDDVFSNCVILIRSHPEWGIDILQDGSDSVRALESKVSSKTLWCRIYKASNKVFKQLIAAVAAICSIFAFAFFIKRYKKSKREREAEIYTMVERIVEKLQRHYDTCKSNPDLDPCLAILHVRDMLIPLPQRVDKSDLWDKAVKLIDNSESRVRVEKQRVAGEDFLVWRWIQPTSSPDLNKGKIWQGQAFGTTEKSSNVLPFCPTPCLKIRNMFDPEVEYGDNWPVTIHEAILEKCEGNDGIVHLHIDVASKEGCVYMKCNSSNSAGQAYKALHGWWFDRKLVTVKYLRLERYHERFPDSRQCYVGLKPTNVGRPTITDLDGGSNQLENS